MINLGQDGGRVGLFSDAGLLQANYLQILR